MTAQQNALSTLRDIHLPKAVSWWPLAPGWYIVLTILAIILVTLSIFGYRYWQRLRRKRFLLKQIQHLQQQVGQTDNATLIIAALSTLLRKAALAKFPRDEVASLHGEAWLHFLDHSGRTTEFTQGQGRLLMTAPYQATFTADNKEIFLLASRWVKRCL